jgi:hypothetical protein
VSPQTLQTALVKQNIETVHKQVENVSKFNENKKKNEFS